MQITEFPAEYFIKLEGQDFLLGRLSINKMNKSFWVEVDIVQKESKKIFAHVGNLYNVADLDEAITSSVQMLSKYVKP
ncbi:hypothetical protein DOM21_11135 [Bacteriovorax stolpii]|uniref:Uncharacterized protein n=1 Tax=Bacteriovorax stolpii TaxID=960 RepID=A0A2K9NR70_BACTC|nr:hypothetical protein [Bacteriovorax stolpii]AUN98026.1 hypothetical protein C0V70_07870 [Bacteriovorax stolpii]QDK41990.1 hypothetical protein DOM21_11135 [Bacteriovorax stolpii]TDP50285.1 hypothetical protein C8D79_3788 [Bacteriovorax stolpii]